MTLSPPVPDETDVGAPKSSSAASRLRPAKARITKFNRREALAGYLFISPWIVGFLVFTLGAMIYSLVISFTHYNLATGTAPPAGKGGELPGP